MNYDFSDMIIDPAPTEVKKNLSTDIQEKLDINRPTKSVVLEKVLWLQIERNAAQ